MDWIRLDLDRLENVLYLEVEVTSRMFHQLSNERGEDRCNKQRKGLRLGRAV